MRCFFNLRMYSVHEHVCTCMYMYDACNAKGLISLSLQNVASSWRTSTPCSTFSGRDLRITCMIRGISCVRYVYSFSVCTHVHVHLHVQYMLKSNSQPPDSFETGWPALKPSSFKAVQLQSCLASKPSSFKTVELRSHPALKPSNFETVWPVLKLATHF